MTGREPLVSELETEIGTHLALSKVTGGTAPARIQDRYEVRSILGSGGFGTVVRAWDPTLRREVAVKCVPSSDPARTFEILATEAHALAKLSVTEVVGIHDCAMTQVVTARRRMPCVAIVMELVPGCSLRRWLNSQQEQDHKLAVLISAARGLEAAHAVELIHRDFKPENVLVTDRHEARIVDFGLAYGMRTVAQTSQLVARGSFGIGTHEYMAPEAYRGAVTPRSDQFSYAVTAWELLTGTRPFRGPSLTAARTDPREFDGADRLSSQLREILSRALRFELSERFESISQLRRALEGGAFGGGRLAAVLTGVAAVAAVATTSYFVGKQSRDSKKS